jgi:hypothetical protein
VATREPGGDEPDGDAVPIVVEGQSLPPAKPFYRACSNRVIPFFTTSKQELEEQCNKSGYINEGTVCKLWATHALGTTPLYRSLVGGWHVYTTSEQEKDNLIGWRAYQGIAGFVLLAQHEGTVPFYRMPHDSSAHKFSYIVCDEERHRFLQSGPSADKCLGFVMPP